MLNKRITKEKNIKATKNGGKKWLRIYRLSIPGLKKVRALIG